MLESSRIICRTLASINDRLREIESYQPPQPGPQLPSNPATFGQDASSMATTNSGYRPVEQQRVSYSRRAAGATVIFRLWFVPDPTKGHYETICYWGYLDNLYMMRQYIWMHIGNIGFI